MTTIILASPKRTGQPIQVFGNYEGRDDRYTFGIREFAVADAAKAERHAKWMMERFGADHFERS